MPAEYDLDGSDTMTLDDPSGPLDWRPTRHFDAHETSLSFTDAGSGPGLLVLDDHDTSLNFNETPLLVKLNFNGADSFGLTDSGAIKFPITLHSFDDVVGLDDSTDSSYSIAVRSLDGHDSFGFLEIPVLFTAGYEVSEADDFGFLEFFEIDLVLGSNNKIGSDSVAFTDSGTLSVAKAGADVFVISEFSCICWEFNKHQADNFGLAENPLLWINNRRVTSTVPVVLPGGHGARFNAIIRWNKVESVELTDNGYRVDDEGNPILDSNCCLGLVIPPPVEGEGWSALSEWHDLDGWSDLGV